MAEPMTSRLLNLIPARWRRETVPIPVVRLAGMIGAVTPIRPGITLTGVSEQLKRAFTMKRAPAVAILINSPGGSPVQSHLVFKRIRALAEETKRPVIVAVEDVAASGGYMIALAGDEIIVDPSSIVGSIGVISAGFGFPKLLDRLGIERRVHAAGENKAMLDPFQPERDKDVQHLKALQRDVHDLFIDLVRARRGARLSDEPELFTGAFWSGVRSVELGLADQVGDLRTVLRERYGETVDLRLLAPKRGFLRGFGGGGAAGLRSATIAAEAFDGALASLEERSLWARFGL